MSKTIEKVLYLSGVIEPFREGISKEVFTLHNNLKSSYVVGTSPSGHFMHSQSGRYFGFPSKFLSTLRFWVPLVAHKFCLIHIFQGIDCYHYLKIKGNKPVILTAISVDHILSTEHYRKVHTIVVESLRDREKLIAHGFESNKVIVIFPGTDLSVFNDLIPPPKGRFKILFASSPFSLEYMKPRGVRLLLEAAKIKNDVDFVLLWRKRGGTLNLLQQWISELSLTNVKVIHEDITHINRLFVDSHATIVPFTSEKNTKSCPNSAVESLATGRPVLVSNKVGLADIVKAEQSGVVFEPRIDSLVTAITSLQQRYASLKENSRKCANKYFDEKLFLDSYRRLYETVDLSNRRVV